MYTPWVDIIGHSCASSAVFSPVPLPFEGSVLFSTLDGLNLINSGLLNNICEQSNCEGARAMAG